MAVTIFLVVAAFGVTPASAAARTGKATASTAVQATVSRPVREVFGFALASSLSDPTIGYPSWNFDLLSTVAFFGLHVNGAGQFVSDSYRTVWNSSALTSMVTIAHQHGTKVVLTVILQDFSANTPTMCAGLSHADVTVAATVAEVKAKGVDGVNIDYEGLNGACGTTDAYWARHAMAGFAKSMRLALGTGYYLSVDTYASSATDTAGFFDVASLALYVDSLFVMAYDLEYSNYKYSPLSCSRLCLGPTSPLTGYYYNDTTIASQYVARVGAKKTILGIPYYGRKACVGATVANAYPTSSVVADSYLDAAGEAAYFEVKPGTYAVHRDTHSGGMERWDTWYNTTLGCTRELYWDDAVSLGKKYDLVNSAGLRGVGIWNLNYGGGAPELWSALANHFVRCTGAGITAAPASTSVSGTTVTLTATSSGCASPLYQFWIRPSTTSTWKVLQPYSANGTAQWNGSGTSGTFYFSVWAKAAGSGTSTFEANATLPYVVTPASCAAVAMSASPASPIPHGAGPVTFSAAASGCSNANPLYEFWMLTGSTWKVVRGWSTTASWTWSSSTAAAGTYRFGVWVRDAASPGTHDGGSMGRYDAFAGMPFTLGASCTSVTETASPGSPVAHGTGTQVTFTATAAGCTDPNPLYEFWMLNGSTWKVVQGWSTDSTWVWNTTGLPAGTYHFGVWVRDAASPGAYVDSTMGRYDAFVGLPFTLS